MNIAEVIQAIEEDRPPREPDPPPPPEPAAPLAEVEAQTQGEPNDERTLETRVRALPPEAQMRALRGLLHEIASWYRPVEQKTRLGRRWISFVEYILGNPHAIFRTDPPRARRVVDAALAIVAVTGIAVHKIGDPHPPVGTWGFILGDLDALLQGPNMVALREHHRIERLRLRESAAENVRFREGERAIMRAFLNGDIVYDDDTGPSVSANPVDGGR